jgi:hypothetical protein
MHDRLGSIDAGIFGEHDVRLSPCWAPCPCQRRGHVFAILRVPLVERPSRRKGGRCDEQASAHSRWRQILCQDWRTGLATSAFALRIGWHCQQCANGHGCYPTYGVPHGVTPFSDNVVNNTTFNVVLYTTVKSERQSLLRRFGVRDCARGSRLKLRRGAAIAALSEMGPERTYSAGAATSFRRLAQEPRRSRYT